jgi:hypothetical protein
MSVEAGPADEGSSAESGRAAVMGEPGGGKDAALGDGKDVEPGGAKAAAVGDGERCALEGCELPLPPRGLDEQGRAKGGRRPQYCSKAHADAASRQRRAREVASVEDPLALARSAGEAFLPGARALAAQLSELIARFDEAEAGALARVQAAEQEASSAAAEALAARENAEAAEQARRVALAQARQDRQARDNAIKEADRARSEAEQVRTAAWEQVAVHERGRGQAEAARLAAQASADALIGQNRELREQNQLAQKARVELTALLADTRQDQERAEGVNRALSARVEAVERLSAREGERLRDRADVLQGRVGELQAELAGASATVGARSEQVSGLQAELTELRALLSGVQKQLTEVQVELATARAELVAARSRAAREGETDGSAELEGDTPAAPLGD